MTAKARDYRYGLCGDLTLHNLVVGETDLALSLPPGIWTERLAKVLLDHIVRQRSQLQQYIARHPDFAASHRPVKLNADAPPLARRMARAAAQAGVGPMAAVAGALAASAGKVLAEYSNDLIVENGGDIYIASHQERIIGVFAGESSPFSGHLGIKLDVGDMPCGVCTSSGTVGSSFSYGKADAAMIIAADAALADAVATAAGNLVQSPADVEGACRFAMERAGISAALVICGDAMAAMGQIELTQL